MDFDKLFPGRFLKAGLFGGQEVTLTITAVAIEQMEKEDKSKETKGILSFKERPLQLVLNKTNGLCIREMFGRETDEWVGKRVTFFPDTLDGELCIRVRGSPDLQADHIFELKLPRKKAREITLKKTAAKASASPALVTSTGEPPDDVPLPVPTDGAANAKA